MTRPKTIPSRVVGLALVFLFCITLAIIYFLAVSPGQVDASSINFQSAQPSPTPVPGDEACMKCHIKPGQATILPDGEVLPISIDPNLYTASVHPSAGHGCIDCHTTITVYPHPPLTAKTLREYDIQLQSTCQECHKDQYQKAHDSVHNTALTSGNQNAPVCSDCHNSHAQLPLTDQSHQLLPAARLQIPQVCARCHSSIYDQYKKSVHGAALVTGNTDVPSCIDCHGVHNIGDPRTAASRLSSPQLCSGCHTDEVRMAKYKISTQVLNTYVADFHGTTVTLFEKLSPDQQTNKPVCVDCHGVHNIVKVDDPQKGLLLEQNLLAVCKKCHPGATDNFPAAWLSHYIPSPTRNPVVYYVNLLYPIFVTMVLGGMATYIGSDILRRQIDRHRGERH
jgi:hypothetical protein